MKERPIIFSAEVVRTILEGRATMTRRVIKLKDYSREIWDSCVAHNDESAILLGEPYLKIPYDPIMDNAGTRITCPYGQIGDRLWVRERWWALPSDIRKGIAKFYYQADYTEGTFAVAMAPYPDTYWKYGMFMPKIASRILLEITQIRVERLQEITVTDCITEGVQEEYGYPSHTLARFSELWDSLNAKRGYGWEKNPWVWVIGFSLIGARLK